jgi:hypothetical protein
MERLVIAGRALTVYCSYTARSGSRSTFRQVERESQLFVERRNKDVDMQRQGDDRMKIGD